MIARDRAAGAALARTAGASVIVMDDGFQNPALRKTLSLIVMDAHRGIGNGAVFPSGPMRAPLDVQAAHTDALIVIGDGAADLSKVTVMLDGEVPVMKARVVPDEHSIAALKGRRLLAFAGIGDPARFFATLAAAGLDVAATESFPDHHRFNAGAMQSLVARAAREHLTLVTTEKDMMRIATDPEVRSFAVGIVPFAVTMMFDDAGALERLLLQALQR